TATTDFYELVQRQATAEILPGRQTTIWGYNGISPGPTIKARRGRDIVVRQINALPAKHPQLGYRPTTSTHLHGSDSLPQYDGYASDITDLQQYKDYVYPNDQDARTMWYHDHGVHHTAQNAYMGLAGQYHLSDAVEDALAIPKGRYDVPLIIKDVLFDTDGQLLYDDRSQSGLMGHVITVNGKPWPAMRVEQRKYRFRVLNVSLSRAYKLSLSTNDPITVIGTDGGLMPRPQQTAALTVGMAERYDIVIDFAKYPVGTRVELRNGALPNNVDFRNTNKVMAFDVASAATDTTNNQVPAELNPNTAVMGLTAEQATRTRRFAFERKNGLWVINGTTWQDVERSGFTQVAADPALGDTEIWEFQTTGGGWFHPIHVHLVDFRILDRNGRAPASYELGPKDTTYVAEGETVRMVARFGPHQGRYMIHCHNLVHEDHDMMVQFQVGTGGPDPITAAPAKALPAPPL
ncbi:MAG: multicopper oxidase domain-containing protein, partial [Actinobacteria bacterium]|nr:multicopper oxidase domain-containing protein [Actinomycetota bacterium]